MTHPRLCARCGLNPVGYSGRECCYTCVPRRRRAPLRCKRCGSDDFYTAGLCRRCHRSAPLVDSCRDCLAWGATRHEKWLCQACRGWHRRYADASNDCPTCGRHVVVNDRGHCRLCCRQAKLVNQRRRLHETTDMAAVNRDGQQLFFADLILKKRGKAHRNPPTRPARYARPSNRFPVAHRQLVLFAAPRTLDTRHAWRPPPIPELADLLENAIDDHVATHGWQVWQRDRVRLGIRVLLTVQDTPGAPIRASEVASLNGVEATAMQPVIEVLESVGMFEDDREPQLESWFRGHTEALPTTMAQEVGVWFRAMRDGSDTAPRVRARSPMTLRRTTLFLLPVLREWADAGLSSLREIARQDVITALDRTDPRRRVATLSSLRSLFRFLKGRKVVFVNPTAHLRQEPNTVNPPLPIDITLIRDAINSADPARAALTALVAFHGLRNIDLRRLNLGDLQGDRLDVGGNRIILAEPVGRRLRAWLDERTRRWPNTANPHLFITSRTALRTTPASDVWVIDTIGVSPFKIRQDRILNEAIATSGDVRRLTDLFDISVGTAQRYTAVLDHADLVDP